MSTWLVKAGIPTAPVRKPPGRGGAQGGLSGGGGTIRKCRPVTLARGAADRPTEAYGKRVPERAYNAEKSQFRSACPKVDKADR